MHVLYWSRNTGSVAPQALLEELGIPYETRKVDIRAGEHRAAAYRRDVHPLGTVPALRLPDGRVLIESGAIVLYLAEIAAVDTLMPPAGTPERALFHQWLVYGAATLYPTCLRYHHPDQFTDEDSHRARAVEIAGRQLDERWQVVEAGLKDGGPFLFGGRHTAADIYLAMLALWHPEPGRFHRNCPRVDRLRVETLDLPSMRAALAAHEREEG